MEVVWQQPRLDGTETQKDSRAEISRYVPNEAYLKADYRLSLADTCSNDTLTSLPMI